MALETATFLDELVSTNPLASDNVSQGDNHLRLIKSVLQSSFPSVDMAVNAIHASSSAPAESISAGLLWFDLSANVLKIRNEANDAWVTLAVSPVTSNSVDINAGTVDGAIVGGSSAAAGTFTTLTANTSLTMGEDATIIFEGATDDAYETTLTVVDPTADRTVSIPNATDTLVGKATTDTLTNKTLTSPTINAGALTGAFTGTADLTGLVLQGASPIVLEGATSDAYETTIAVTDPTADRTWTIPNSTDTFVGKATTDTLTNKTLTSPVLNGTLSGTAFLDEDDMSSDSAIAAASQQSIKAYVTAQITAEDLDITTDSGTIDIDLNSETLTIAGGAGIDTSASSTTVTIAGEDASSSNKGIASFSSDNFSVSSGAVTIKDAGVANAELANMAANTIKVRDANSSGVPSDKALATTQILIGDGTGFTAAALSSDVTMTNAGAVTIANNAVSLAKMAGLARGKIIYGDSSGDPAALAVGSANYVLTSDGTDISWAAATTGDITAVNVTSPITGGGSSGAVTIAIQDASTSAKGAASFSSDNFAASSGAITIKDAGVANAELANMAANTVKVRDANSSGVPSDKAVADTQILIGDGTGFTAAALSGDVTMANTGAVTIAANSVDGTMIAMGSDAQGDVMYYNGTNWARLGYGTDGHFLKTQGASANPVWAAASGSGATDIDGLSDALVENNSIWLGNDPSSTTDTASNNVAVGVTALDAITTGDDNVAIGQGALSANTTGTRNTAVGWAAAPAVISANDNTAMGWSALYATTGAENTAIGSYAMQSNTSGASNTALGDHALFANTTASNNVAIGIDALDANTTGTPNTAVGRAALGANTTGSANVAVGETALEVCTTSVSNTAVGNNALGNITTGAGQNVGVGRYAGMAVTTGTSNVFDGYYSGPATTTGSNNVGVGAASLSALTTGGQNTAVGQGALDAATTVSGITAIGHAALSALTTGAENQAFGHYAGAALTTATACTLVGHRAGAAITTGASNTIIGKTAGDAITTGGNSVCIGVDAGGNVTTGDIIAVGNYAGQNMTTGVRMTAIGTSSGGGTGNYNTAVGYDAFKANDSGGQNSCFGDKAGDSITTGSNNTCIGYDADNSGATTSNEFTLGNSSTDNLRCADTSISALSDERDKAEITDLPSNAGLDFVNSLRPVTFYWDHRDWYSDGSSDGSKVTHDYDNDIAKSGQRMGFIAQEVKDSISGMKYMEDSQVVNGTEEKLEFAPAHLITPLVKAIQQLSEEVESLKAQLEG